MDPRDRPHAVGTAGWLMGVQDLCRALDANGPDWPRANPHGVMLLTHFIHPVLEALGGRLATVEVVAASQPSLPLVIAWQPVQQPAGGGDSDGDGDGRAAAGCVDGEGLAQAGGGAAWERAASRRPPALPRQPAPPGQTAAATAMVLEAAAAVVPAFTRVLGSYTAAAIEARTNPHSARAMWLPPVAFARPPVQAGMIGVAVLTGVRLAEFTLQLLALAFLHPALAQCGQEVEAELLYWRLQLTALGCSLPPGTAAPTATASGALFPAVAWEVRRARMHAVPGCCCAPCHAMACGRHERGRAGARCAVWGPAEGQPPTHNAVPRSCRSRRRWWR
jgi:hypothetical protein